MGLLASFLIRILHGLTGSLLPDQPWDDGVKYLPLPDADSDIPQAPQPRSSGEDISSERNWLELGTTVFSSRTEEAKLRDAPYLDWLLIEISEKNLQRPNILNTDTVDGLPTVFQEVFSGSTQGDVPVLMLSGVMGPRQAVLLSGTAYFGGLHHRKPTLSWCIKLLDSQGIRAGESGSLIINPETQQIYGHIVAAGAHGYGYITPMFETLKQIQQSLGTRSEVVSIPDPILQLAQLEVYYEGINDKENAELAVRTLQRSLIENPLQNSQSLLGATRRKDEKAVEILLATGAKVDVVDPNTKSTALHIASMNGNLGITRMLLDEGANVRARNCNGDTPMIVARMHGNTHIIHMLVEAGAPDDSRRHDDPRLNLAAKGSLFGDSWQMNAMPNHMPQAPPPATSAESFYKSQLQANVDSYTPTFSGSETLGLKGY
ncbi:hypothetical protein DL98DRAFT_468869 [Cadophora sp. DSE1049]|nr:hypothetical protein DL98DRAFT_468869 [Cadophora sp. DSE1049]